MSECAAHALWVFGIFITAALAYMLSHVHLRIPGVRLRLSLAYPVVAIACAVATWILVEKPIAVHPCGDAKPPERLACR